MRQDCSVHDYVLFLCFNVYYNFNHDLVISLKCALNYSTSKHTFGNLYCLCIFQIPKGLKADEIYNSIIFGNHAIHSVNML